MPRGIERIARSIRSRIVPTVSDFFLAVITKRNKPDQEANRPRNLGYPVRICVPHPCRVFRDRVGILTLEFVSANFVESSSGPERF